MKLAVAGKGGAGKSLIAGTLARLLAQRGERVLALDSDMMPGLAFSLGTADVLPPPLMDAAERDERNRWRFRPGIGPARAIQRFSVPAPDGVRLLQAGKVGAGGTPAIMPALQAFYRTVHAIGGLRSLRGWWVIGDLPAGPRQAAFDWAPYAETFLLVVEPTSQSMLAARRVARVVSMRPGPTVTPVASRVRGRADVERIEAFLGTRVAGRIPLDPAVREAERAGIALVDHAPASPAVEAIASLIALLERSRVSAAA